MAGYHLKDISKGVFGELSKVEEELEELKDALAQGIDIMALCELSDLIGAIEAFSEKRFKVTLQQLLLMSNATKRAFKDGSRS